MIEEQTEPILVDLENWRSIAATLPEGWEEIAVSLGLGPSQHDPHNASRLSADVRVHTLLTMVALNLSLRATSGLFAAAGIHRVSHVGIHGWLKQSGQVFESILQAMVLSGSTFASERWAGYIVRAIDATTAQRPGAKGTTARIHLALRLSDMRVDQVKVSTVRTGETFRNFKTYKGILDVADRGYSNPPSIEAAVMQHGDVLVRWNFASLPLWSRDCRTNLDVRDVTRGLEAGQRRELQVAIHRPGKLAIPGRLLVERLPDAEAEKARQRARAEDSGPLGIEMAPYVMLFTTVPEERLSAAQLFELYRLRWQIELEFKREKSIAGLDLLPNFVEETIQAWLLAKLLLNQIARRLYDRAQPAASAAAQGPESGASLPVTMPWYAAVTATVLLRAGLLSFRLQHLDLVLARLGAQLSRLRTRGKKARRQIEDFLASCLVPSPRIVTA